MSQELQEDRPVQCRTSQGEERRLLPSFGSCFVESGLGLITNVQQEVDTPSFRMLRNCLRSLLAVFREEVSMEGAGTRSCLAVLLHVTLRLIC